jgi:hypothetical protein
MRVSIATVEKIEGQVSAIDASGVRRELTSGDQVFLDEVVSATARGYAQLQVLKGDSFCIEALQSVKLNADLSTDIFPEISDCVLSSQLSGELTQQLLSSVLVSNSQILTDLEPIFELSKSSADQEVSGRAKLAISDILPSNNGSKGLDEYLRFDQVDENTIVYLSTQGKLTNLEDAQEQADKILTINSTAYSNNNDVLSYLLENHLIE